MIETFETRSANGSIQETSGVPRLVEGDDLLLALVDAPALLLEPRDDPLDRLLELAARDEVLVPPRGEERRLVHDVREVRAGEARRPRGDGAQVHVRPELHVLRVDLEDLLAPALVGAIDEHLPVEAAGAHQRRIEDLRAGSSRP